MTVSVAALTLLVTVAFAVAAVSPIVLVGLLVFDLKRGRLW